MLPSTFVKGYNQRRLRNMLAALFLALAVPTGAVVWQAWDQLQWEAWFQHRNQAEALTQQIDLTVAEQVRLAESRSFTDFAFVTGTATANVVQRSPLAGFPAPQDVAGAIGYFQVDPVGSFSTPFLPDAEDPATYGLAPEDVEKRAAAASDLRRILAENQLVDDRVAVNGQRLRQQLTAEAPATNTPQLAPATATSAAPAEIQTSISDDAPVPSPGVFSSVLEAEEIEAEPEKQRLNEQDAFDQLNQPGRMANDELAPSTTADMEDSVATEQAFAYGKVQDLRLDEDLQKRSEALNRDIGESAEERKDNPADGNARARRIEQTTQYTLPEPAAEAGSGGKEEAITTFESEIDPYQFNLLDSGHMVLYRNAWLDGDRYIQGLLIDQPEFARTVVENAFRATTLSGMSDLVVGHRDDVINVFRGGSYDKLPVSSTDLAGELLYRARLSAPLDSIELIFAINAMPPGPGAAVLGWTTIVIGIVFVGGFLALYRLGLSQIRLARQQQDFVSAVSHELKTPLTSIRMYGEMLKEGWADPDKQKQYFEYIHDESERLTRLISNVLQLARITRNEPQFDASPVTVAELMDQVRSKISNHVERAGFELQFDISPDANKSSINVDTDCFAQIVINLVDNAIKFSKGASRKRVEISCLEDSDKNVMFAVRDYGPGIDKGQLRKIFELFYRSESELTRETVGTGIGLAIVHQLTTVMGGSVDVMNREPGAEFRVSFPAHTN